MFFKQSYYKHKGKEEVKLLCWGMCKDEVGFVSFSLPEIVSTRFISLVATGVHSSYYVNGNEEVNVDIMKFIPHGVIVPCL